MTYDWEGKRRYDAALVMRHTLLWLIYLPAQGLRKVGEHRAYILWDVARCIAIFVTRGTCGACVAVSTEPPTYSSVFKRVQAARQQSTSKAGFIRSLPGILVGRGMLFTSSCFVVTRADAHDTTVAYIDIELSPQ